jgi:hypothetical protein
MSYVSVTGKTIQESFEEFHLKNPIVYEHFKELAFRAIGKGKNKISFKMIMNVIRWDIFIKTSDEPMNLKEMVKFKINDAYGSRYARLFVSDFPEHKSKIEMRNLRS